MRFDLELHHRRSIRLKGYNYSGPGGYYVTICTQNRHCLFGEVEVSKMVLNDAGQMIQTEWLKLSQRFTHVELDEFIVMPNHLHGIMIIHDDGNVGAPLWVPQGQGRAQGLPLH